MIDFSLPMKIAEQVGPIRLVAEGMMRPASRYYDDHEHERFTDFAQAMWTAQVGAGYRGRRPVGIADAGYAGGEGSATEPKSPRLTNLTMIYTIEMLSWGDAGIYLTTPGAALAGAAVQAVGTPEQKARFLTRFGEGDPKWGAMCMTEPQAGSDTANIRTSAKLSDDGKEWILNGEKIFVTNGLMAGQDSNGILVVWATVDPKAGRAGMKSFVVEANTPGMKVQKLEHKHGIRASDTAVITFDNCHIPFDNILGSPEVQQGGSNKGFKGAMATFDATRPAVAASAIGIGRASLDFILEELERQGSPIRYGVPYQKQTAVERDVITMQGKLKAAWLLTLDAASKMDTGIPNTIESSMCKVKAGEAITWITQKAVEILGPNGYSTKLLLEKWMRDGKINDLYEGTGQINRLIVARRMLGYTSAELR